MAPSGNTATRDTEARARARANARPRRPLNEAIAHAPQTLRALVRADEMWLVVLAAGVGLAAGLVVSLMNVIGACVIAGNVRRLVLFSVVCLNRC